MGASEMATNNLLGEDDMLALGGEDDDDQTGTKITQEDHLLEKQPSSPTQGILDLFTVPSAPSSSQVNDPFAPGALPPKPPTDHLADDVSALSMETGFPPASAAPMSSSQPFTDGVTHHQGTSADEHAAPTNAVNTSDTAGVVDAPTTRVKI